MKRIIAWIKDHLPKWLDLSHDKPWEQPDE